MVLPLGTSSYAKEMAIRRRIADIFNKREEDFPSLKEYNDYLEEVEDMTCNLIEGIDVPAIEAKIAKYEEENAEQIINAQARKAEDLAAALKASMGHLAQPDAIDVVAGQNFQASGSGVGGQGHYAPTTMHGGAFAQPRPTGTTSQPLPLEGYAADNEEALKLRAEKVARAGGWTFELSKRRALEEAFSSILV